MNNMNKTTDHEHMRAEMDKLIASLDLPELNKEFMRARWLELVIWMDGKAQESVWWYRRLRLATIIGGVIVPALVSLNVSSDASSDVASTIAWTTFALSLLVATAVSVEGFFRYGERWRHYRRTAELMKSQGWQFFELSGRSFPRFPTGANRLRGPTRDRW